MKTGLVLIALMSAGAATGASANLLVNGDFSGGYAGFSSDYRVVAANGTVYTTPPAYALTTNAGTGFTNGYLSYGDHTSGTGAMLLFDGAGPGLDVWRETVGLAANTTYVFAYYATTPDGGVPVGSDLGNLETKVNGAAVGTGTTITSQGGNPWQKISTTFTTGAAGLYTLAITDLNGTAQDNDDTLDDLSLDLANPAGAVPEPASWALMISGFGLVGGVLRRQRTVSASA